MQETVAWIALAEILGARSAVFLKLMQAFADPEAIFAADRETLAEAVPELGAGTLSALTRGVKGTDAERIYNWCRKADIKVLPWGQSGYPTAFLALPDPPVVLYCRGELPGELTGFTVGVVGTRDADAYGARVAYKLSFELAAAGAVIVSGMADGIDGIAAAAALDAGGRTVAVLGCGIDIAYPRHHARLMREIAAQGAVITEYAPGTPPNGWQFPVRNRLISALSDAVAIIEAGERSGALITAKYAVLQGKPLFAVPGDITAERSYGTNRLLEEGAQPLLCAENILGQLRFLYHDFIREDELLRARACSVLAEGRLEAHGIYTPKEQEQTAKKEPSKHRADKTARTKEAPKEQEIKEQGAAPMSPSLLSSRQRELYEKLPTGAFPLDAVTALGVDSAQAAAALTMMELCGLIVARPGGLYEKI